MDKYLTLFTGQLDAVFDPETLFPGKKVHTMGWLGRKLSRKRAAISKIKKVQHETNFNPGHEPTHDRFLTTRLSTALNR